MLSRSQVFVLLLVFVITGMSVFLLRQWSNRTLLAEVVIVAHDGDLLDGGLASLQGRIQTDEFAGVFYEKHDHGYLLPFKARLDVDLLSALQNADSLLVWYNMEPDSFFLRTWSLSYSQLLQRLPSSVSDSLNNRLFQTEALRRQALIRKGAQREQLLKQITSEINASTSGMDEKLMRRYAREMLNGFSKTALKQPGKKWLFIVDIALYPYLEQAFATTPRFGHEK